MKIYIFIITLISASIFTYSQNGDVNLEDIRIPNSPAFILLDVAPTSIDKPVNSKAFATSILNSLTENNGIPQNYAIEFTPYWYFEHPELDAFRYWGVNKDKCKNTWFSNVKQASISFAYVKVNDSLNLETFDNAALGVRLNLIRINKSKDIDTLIEVNERLIEALKAIDTATKDLMANLDPIDPLYKIKVKELLDSKENDVQLMELESQLRKFLTRKPLFSVDLASAANYCFSKNDFSSSFFDRYGIWMTASLAAVINPNNTRNLKRNYLNFYNRSPDL